MKNDMLLQVAELKKKRKRNKRFKNIISVLAVGVIFCTIYALTLPAITMAKEPICGQEEHTHTEACYTQISDVQFTCILDENQVVLHTHDGNCYDSQNVLICKLPEVKGHSHEEACMQKKAEPTCEYVHTHGETCFDAEGILTCELLTEEGHEHDENCYEQEIICGVDALEVHNHEEACYGEDGTLICGKNIVTVHQHDENCRKETTDSVLNCSKLEHTHVETCYPVEEKKVDSEYLCGMGVHTHKEACYGEDGTLVCNIPEHDHVAACIVTDLDLTADIEEAATWEQAANITLSGDWAKDLVAVAQTQIGYTESTKNVVLEDKNLKGYTLYGARYGTPYADWSAEFVAFCMEKAQIKDFYTSADEIEWMNNLNAQQTFIPAASFTPKAGDIVFWDRDLDGTADGMGILAEVLEDTNQWNVISGDGKNHSVELESYNIAGGDASILGGCILPQTTMTTVQLEEAETVKALIEALPTSEMVTAELTARNQVLDREGYDAYLAQVKEHASKAQEAYNKLSDTQKALVTGAELPSNLIKLCEEAVWVQLPVLEDDSARVSVLKAERKNEDSVQNGMAADVSLMAELVSCTESSYSEGRVKIEAILPLTQEQAVFDLDRMLWMEEAEVTTETRIINEEEISCQVLTGYKHLKADTMDGSIIPGKFTEDIAVNVLDMKDGDVFHIQVSAAMEYNHWDGVCETHKEEEKLIVTSPQIMILGEDPSKTEQDQTLGDMDPEAIAEPCVGNNWEALRGRGWFTEYSNSVAVAPTMEPMPLRRSMAMPANRMAAPFSLNPPQSAEQIVIRDPVDVNNDGEPDDIYWYNGEGVTSSDGAVYVNKTIVGTDIENVFDITLEVVTQDKAKEVYEEPNMAVVIVMDISNTMKSNFEGVTRYEAAMEAATNFLNQFAKYNSIGASKVGFVAFNSDAHEIFPMSICTNETEADALDKIMRNKTGAIMSGYETNDAGQVIDEKRYTNIEAGLKRASDMLKTVNNEHKYIVFLSDGFPTTYIQNGYTGYKTSTGSGIVGKDGVFYDAVMGVYCNVGTSYSDKAAIRAREMAESIKKNGTIIFSIGVGVKDQTIQYYIDQSVNDLKTYSVVDRTSDTDYEIGDAKKTESYKNWLKTKIGSGYYHDSGNKKELEKAFEEIFKEIIKINTSAESSRLDWVASDPLPTSTVHELDDIEFIGFFNYKGELVGNKLEGKSADGWENENTAIFVDTEKEIQWDLKNSRYVSTATENGNNYYCSLTYRVRLKNENGGFKERPKDPKNPNEGIYKTNDTTILTYRVIEVENNVVEISEQREIAFPLPQVKGYLAELTFKKVGSTGEAVEGAEFTLRHDPTCTICHGDGSSVAIESMVVSSDANGTVTFHHIPSGHKYILEETGVPAGYQKNTNTYHVTVSYDQLTVAVKDKDGNDVNWDGMIVNHTEYNLPNTGGTGTEKYTVSGLLIMISACAYYLLSNRKKNYERREII